MNLCSDNHEEVCFTGRHCPACEIQQKLNAAEVEIESLKNELQSSKEEPDQL